MIQKHLHSWGYEVIRTGDGQKAWEIMLAETPPPLVILDWVMPGRDGVALCRSIRAAESLKSTYVILLTAKDGKKEIISGLEAGADDYITKPFDPAELQVRIAAGKRVVELLQERQQGIERQIDLWNRIDTLLHTIPSGILIVDAQTQTIVDANPTAIMMIGVPLEKLVGRGCLEFICIPDKGRCPLSDLGRKIDCSERVLRNSEGDLIPIQKSVSSAVIDGVTYYIENFIDLTEIKRLEAEKIERERLQVAFEMAGAICHEINQPLQAASGLTELLLHERNRSDPSCKKISQIKEQIDRMGAITKKLTKITKYETKGYLGGRIMDIDKSSK
jgi:PAS domain S-box-containing protein